MYSIPYTRVQTQSGSHQFSANIAGAKAISSIMAILEMANISIGKRDFVLPFDKENVFFNMDIRGVHKLRLQDFSFFDHLPPSVYIFYGI